MSDVHSAGNMGVAVLTWPWVLSPGTYIPFLHRLSGLARSWNDLRYTENPACFTIMYMWCVGITCIKHFSVQIQCSRTWSIIYADQCGSIKISFPKMMQNIAQYRTLKFHRQCAVDFMNPLALKVSQILFQNWLSLISTGQWPWISCIISLMHTRFLIGPGCASGKKSKQAYFVQQEVCATWLPVQQQTLQMNRWFQIWNIKRKIS